jgi:hypothetical protein
MPLKLTINHILFLDYKYQTKAKQNLRSETFHIPFSFRHVCGSALVFNLKKIGEISKASNSGSNLMKPYYLVERYVLPRVISNKPFKWEKRLSIYIYVNFSRWLHLLDYEVLQIFKLLSCRTAKNYYNHVAKTKEVSFAKCQNTSKLLLTNNIIH